MTVTVDDPIIARRARSAAHRGFEGLAFAADTAAPFAARGDTAAERDVRASAALAGADEHPAVRPDPERRCVTARGDNPFCGDELEVRAELTRTEAGEWAVARAAFDGYACTLCLAAADALMEAAEGMTLAQVQAATHVDVCRWLGGLAVGRTRKGCVDLPLTVLHRALLTVVE